MRSALRLAAGVALSASLAAAVAPAGAAEGLNPNVWFENVEQVAAWEVGQEPVRYVANIYKYYVAYQLVAEAQQVRDAARKP